MLCIECGHEDYDHCGCGEHCLVIIHEEQVTDLSPLTKMFLEMAGMEPVLMKYTLCGCSGLKEVKYAN